jgi:drug/metabolite transporter (DMT)-like permease
LPQRIRFAVGATEDNEPEKPRVGRYRDGSDNALFLLAVGAAVAAPCSWLLFYYDQKYIGDVDDRIAFIYTLPVLLSLGALVASISGFVWLVIESARPWTRRTILRLCVGALLLFIGCGLVTAGIMVGALVERRTLK